MSAKTSGPVAGIGASQSAGALLPLSSGAASRASGADAAAACDAATSPSITDGSTSAEVSEPTCAVSPCRTIEITVTCRAVDTPLVVIELFAHRSDVAMRSLTSTIVSSARPEPRRGVQRDVDDLLRADHRPASMRVLSTLTPRNSADGQPWLTAATWPGWALPQLNAPPRRHVDGPPTASIEFQKSVVVAW